MNLDPENRQKLLVILALTGVGLLAGDRLVLSPLLKSWAARSERIELLQKDIAKGRQLLDRRDTVRARWKEMQTNALPVEVSAAEGRVLDAFDRWSRTASVNITSVKPQWKQSDEGYMTFECHVDAAGSLSTVTRFLHEVERDRMAIRVETVELAARDADASQISVGLQVSGLLLNPPAQR